MPTNTLHNEMRNVGSLKLMPQNTAYNADQLPYYDPQYFTYDDKHNMRSKAPDTAYKLQPRGRQVNFALANYLENRGSIGIHLSEKAMKALYEIKTKDDTGNIITKKVNPFIEMLSLTDKSKVLTAMVEKREDPILTSNVLFQILQQIYDDQIRSPELMKLISSAVKNTNIDIDRDWTKTFKNQQFFTIEECKTNLPMICVYIIKFLNDACYFKKAVYEPPDSLNWYGDRDTEIQLWKLKSFFNSAINTDRVLDISNATFLKEIQVVGMIRNSIFSSEVLNNGVLGGVNVNPRNELVGSEDDPISVRRNKLVESFGLPVNVRRSGLSGLVSTVDPPVRQRRLDTTPEPTPPESPSSITSPRVRIPPIFLTPDTFSAHERLARQIRPLPTAAMLNYMERLESEPSPSNRPYIRPSGLDF